MAATLLGLLLATHSLVNLVDNRTLGHTRVRGGIGIAAGAPSFAKYIRFGRLLAGWTRNESIEGKRVAFAAAQAVLDVPLPDPPGDAIYVRLHSKTKQSIRITAQSKTSPAVGLNPGWQTARIPMPPSSLRKGENELRLTFGAAGKRAAAIEWIQIGGDPPPEDAGPPRAGDAQGLSLPIDYYLFIPAAAVLEGTGDGAPGCKLRARATAEGGGSAEGELPLDLSRVAGKVVRLELTGCPRAKSAVLSAAGEPPPLARTPPRNVILWLTDNTRADRLRMYNPKSRVETPTLSRLAERGTVFRGYSQGNESRASHASLWTSLYPLMHGMIPAKAVLAESHVTMPEAIKTSGRWVAGISGNGYVTKRWGFDQGFDLWRNNLHQGGGLSAADIVKTGLGMLRPRVAKDFFFYVGTIDAHTSWRAREPWLSRYDAKNGPYQGPFVKGCMDPQLEKIVTGKLPINARDKDRIRALYDADISYNDSELGKFLAELEKLGHADDTMVIIVSDHGEEFWERGKIGHGQSLHDELVWVPIIVYYPPLFPARVVDGGELVDILPTILDAWGVKAPATWQGESLIPFAQAPAPYPRPSITSHYELAHAMRLGRYKIWVSGTGASRLWDVQADPGETKDVSAQQPLARRWLTDALSIFLTNQKQWRKTRWGVASNHAAALPADLEK